MVPIEAFITEQQIKKRISELATQINHDFKGSPLVVISILNGSFMFTADLVRELRLPIVMDFIKASSYGDNTQSSGQLEISLWTKLDLRGKNVLLVEDIVDTGRTLSVILNKFQSTGANKVKLASLLYKPSRNIIKVPIDYLGFEIEDKFVIGYGLDYASMYRELPYIGIYSED
jgi:hypoxanthine phosphoribosyltransferase